MADTVPDSVTAKALVTGFLDYLVTQRRWDILTDPSAPLYIGEGQVSARNKKYRQSVYQYKEPSGKWYTRKKVRLEGKEVPEEVPLIGYREIPLTILPCIFTCEYLGRNALGKSIPECVYDGGVVQGDVRELARLLKQLRITPETLGDSSFQEHLMDAANALLLPDPRVTMDSSAGNEEPVPEFETLMPPESLIRSHDEVLATYLVDGVSYDSDGDVQPC